VVQRLLNRPLTALAPETFYLQIKFVYLQTEAICIAKLHLTHIKTCIFLRSITDVNHQDSAMRFRLQDI
jgi:hypothetical protein